MHFLVFSVLEGRGRFIMGRSTSASRGARSSSRFKNEPYGRLCDRPDAGVSEKLPEGSVPLGSDSAVFLPRFKSRPARPFGCVCMGHGELYVRVT